MKFIDEYRDADLAQQCAREIHRLNRSKHLPADEAGWNTPLVTRGGANRVLPIAFFLDLFPPYGQTRRIVIAFDHRLRQIHLVFEITQTEHHDALGLR